MFANEDKTELGAPFCCVREGKVTSTTTLKGPFEITVAHLCK